MSWLIGQQACLEFAFTHEHACSRKSYDLDNNLSHKKMYKTTKYFSITENFLSFSLQ